MFGAGGRSHSAFSHNCKTGIFYYVVVKVATSLLTLVLMETGNFSYSYSPLGAYLYIMIATNLSQTVRARAVLQMGPPIHCAVMTASAYGVAWKGSGFTRSGVVCVLACGVWRVAWAVWPRIRWEWVLLALSGCG